MTLLQVKNPRLVQSKCLHLQISTNSNISNEKSCCLDCGMVQDKLSNPYVRNISHYKELYQLGIMIPISQLISEKLRNQAMMFILRETRPKNQKKFPLRTDALENEVCLYLEYVNFLRNNEDKILPRKNRTRQICQVYGDHRKIVLEYIFRLCLQA